MTTLSGRTLVVATDSIEFAKTVVDSAIEASASIAVGCPDPAAVVAINERGFDSANAFAVDHEDVPAWQRIFAHVEQRLGPIDILVIDCDPAAGTTIAELIEADLIARNFGGIVSTRGPLSGRTAPVVTVGSTADVFAAAAALLS